LVLEGMVLDPESGRPLTHILANPYLHDPYRGTPEYTEFRRRARLPP
jgi:hypothetical protein